MMARDKQLDALRGVAALLVLASHVGGALSPDWQNVMAFRFNLGHLGVIVFFLISGRIIPQSIKHGPRTFVIRRVFRLYPLYWLNILLIGGALPVVLANLTMLPSVFDAPHLNGGVWTLQVELTFYASVLLCRRLPAWVPALGFALASLAVPWCFYLAVCWAGSAWSGRYTRVLPLLVLCGTFTPFMLVYESPHVLPRVLAFGLFALWRWQPRALVWTGERSYALYLLHPLVIEHTPAVLWLPVSLLLAAVSYRAIEQPAIALGRRLTLPCTPPAHPSPAPSHPYSTPPL